ncbi:aminotransferase class V-fold PLP-dependent enzyme [uncultured Paraglaciecola sp.]|uniref:aminotransferase class V-fold PLP-dependent enzyme n=1 Tax=uncultured Paraglaciecola sp. TaxID=1765024 RepID=UPI0030D9166A|tara:strand:- start:27932 stop:30229 length:2298 start_codon:yes stop_codon:yes gene_type:complete
MIRIPTNPKQPLSLIYLDANATTQVLPEAAKAALSTMETLFGNPSSSHVTGLQAKQIIEDTRQQARRVIGAGDGKIIFTSGATEGIQTAILSALYDAKKTLDNKKKYCLLYGATEHKAVPESLKHWNKILEINAEVKAIPVNEMGQLDMDFIAREVPNALMICTMAVNNETGVCQDIDLLDQTIRANNSHTAWMVDCVQALGKTNMDLAKTSIDYAPFSGHKLYAPKGVGFIYVKENTPFTAFIAGGGQESGLRSGTENLPGLAALNVIFSMLNGETQHTFTPLNTLHLFRKQIAAALTLAFPHIVFNHSFENSVPTTINFAIPGFSSKEIMDLFDAANIRVSSGSACSSKVTRSFVLDAMGLPVWQSESAIRMSFGPAMTQQEVDLACDRIVFAAKALGQSCLTTDTNIIADKTELKGLVQFKVGGSCSWLYVDRKTKTAIFIDPLPELTERLKILLSCQGLSLIAVIDTHGHADHPSCRTTLANDYLPQQQTDFLGWPVNSKTNNINGKSYPYINLGDKWLVKVNTPGHTSDSMSLLLCDPVKASTEELVVHYAFCGDLILMDSLGRTNFSTSCAAAMYTSLQLLNSLIGPQSLICPSHDYNNEFTTSISAEVSRNSLLAQVIANEINIEKFSVQKRIMDTHIVDQSGSEIMCGALLGSCQQNSAHEYTSRSLAKALEQPNNIKLIDLREPHEYALQHDENFENNVPLTRLVDFVQQHQHNKQQPLVLVCRSGSRSQLAAQALLRLGFEQVGHLKGGYALHQY